MTAVVNAPHVIDLSSTRRAGSNRSEYSWRHREGKAIHRSDNRQGGAARPSAIASSDNLGISNHVEQAFAIVGGSEDELTGLMVQISQVVAREFRSKK